jgi:hypothetical protein
MKQITTLAIQTFIQPFRQKTGWLFLLLSSGIGLFMFTVSQSDGELINELKLRVRFGLAFSLAFTFLVMLWQACISMRGDITSKRMHMLTSHPIRRAWIYLGKWMGLVAYGFVAVLVSTTVVLMAAWIMYARNIDDAQKEVVRSKFWPRMRQVAPFQDSPEELAKKAYNKKLLAGALPPNHDANEKFLELRAEIIRKQRLVPKNGAKHWEFDLSDCPRRGDFVYLNYRFFTYGNAPVSYVWLIGDRTMINPIRVDREEDRPYRNYTIPIPVSVIPENDRLGVEFHGFDNPELLFYQDTGVRILYDEGTLIGNIPRFLILCWAHMALVVAAGLTFSTAFTMSVAAFVSSVFYMVALSSGFFLKATENINLENDSWLMKAGANLTRAALFLVTGLEMPDVVTPMSQSISITPTNIGMQVTRETGALLLRPIRVVSEGFYDTLIALGGDLTMGYLAYFALMAGGGIWLLTRKELDRIH